jgi:gamma-glutamylcyclotransferase (GGCT)/AIG2-like uncharacterized protein YtfP
VISVALFSYGTLQLPDVQRAKYGRLLDGEPDVLAGYALVPLAITDPNIIRVSGKAVHTIAKASGNPADRVAGMVFQLSDAELNATDAYEVDAYARVEAILASGRRAWVYVSGPSAT